MKPGSSSAVAGPSSAAAAPKTAGGPKPSNPYANYSTAESLGFTDPDEERRKIEAERRRKEGVAGEWEVVDVLYPSLPGGEQEIGAGDVKTEHGEDSARAGEKRPAEHWLDEEDTRGWKLRRKKVNVGLDDLYDPGAAPIKLKAKKEEAEEQSLGQAGTSSTGLPGGLLAAGGTEKPRWSARGWNKPGTIHNPSGTANDAIGPPDAESQEDAKPEEKSSQGHAPPEPPFDEAPAHAVKAETVQDFVKPEPTGGDVPAPAVSGGSMFKKRKVPNAGGSRGGRRVV